MEFTAQNLANFLQGIVEGDANIMVNGISKIEQGQPGTLSFLSNPKYTKYIYETDASIVLVNKTFKPEREIKATLIRVEDSYKAFASLMELYNKSKHDKNGIEDFAYIDKSAKIGEKVFIGSFSYISKNASIGNNVKIYPQVFVGENVEIKDNTILYPGVRIYTDCKIGADCIIHSGVVIGSDGFGFAPQSSEDYIKVPQLGNVIIEDKVEIGANTTIDRATMGSTIIRRGVKLDNLIQVAHNVEIGENTVIAAQAGISGSTKIGKDCMIAGQVGIIGHITIADGIKIGAQSGVSSSLKKENVTYLGSPAYNISDTRRILAIIKNLPAFREKILQLEKEIEELKKKL